MKIATIVFVILFVALSIPDMTGIYPSKQDDSIEEHSEVSEISVDVMSNLVKGGSFYKTDDGIYGRFIETEYGFQMALLGVDGDLTPIPVEMATGNIIAFDDYLYFMNFDPPYSAYETDNQEISKYGRIYRYGLKDGSLERLTDEAVSIFYIYGGYLYFQKGYRDTSEWYSTGTKDYLTQIMRMDLDDMSSDELVFEVKDERVSDMFIIRQNQLILPIDNGISGGDIIIYDIKEKTTQQFTNIFKMEEIRLVTNLIATERHIYFSGTISASEYEWDNYLFCLDLETQQLSKVVEDSITSFVVYNNNIIFDSSEGIYRFNLETKEKVFVSEIWNSMLINVVENTLYVITSNSRAQRTSLVIIDWTK